MSRSRARSILVSLLCAASLAFGWLRTRSNAEEASITTVAEVTKASATWDGTPLPAYPEGRPEVTVLRIVVPPGERLTTHYHPVVNVGVVLRGVLTVFKDDGSFHVFREGQAVVELVNRWHYGQNTGSEPLELLVFYVGVEGQPITRYE